MRALFLESPNDERTYTVTDEYFFDSESFGCSSLEFGRHAICLFFIRNIVPGVLQ